MLSRKKLDVNKKQAIPNGRIEEHVKSKSQPVIADGSAKKF